MGVFSASRSRRFYLWMMALGYGIGLPLMVFDAQEQIRNSFSGTYEMHGGLFYNFFGSMVVALGHVGMLMLIVQSGAPDLADADGWRRWGNGAFQLPDRTRSSARPYSTDTDSAFSADQSHGARGDV